MNQQERQAWWAANVFPQRDAARAERASSAALLQVRAELRQQVKAEKAARVAAAKLRRRRARGKRKAAP